MSDEVLIHHDEWWVMSANEQDDESEWCTLIIEKYTDSEKGPFTSTWTVAFFWTI